MKTKTDEQIDNIQRMTAIELKSIAEHLDKIIKVCELNGNKPELVYRHAKDAYWKTKNLAYELESDAKL